MSLARAIDHVQVAIPPQGEAAARRFYGGLLGLRELAKPSGLAQRGGLWFETGTVPLHLGIEANFRPARKAHVAFVVADLTAARQAFAAAGFPAVDDAEREGTERFFSEDPFGNRTEIIAA